MFSKLQLCYDCMFILESNFKGATRYAYFDGFLKQHNVAMFVPQVKLGFLGLSKL